MTSVIMAGQVRNVNVLSDPYYITVELVTLEGRTITGHAEYSEDSLLRFWLCNTENGKKYPLGGKKRLYRIRDLRQAGFKYPLPGWKKAIHGAGKVVGGLLGGVVVGTVIGYGIAGAVNPCSLTFILAYYSTIY